MEQGVQYRGRADWHSKHCAHVHVRVRALAHHESALGGPYVGTRGRAVACVLLAHM